MFRSVFLWGAALCFLSGTLGLAEDKATHTGVGDPESKHTEIDAAAAKARVVGINCDDKIEYRLRPICHAIKAAVAGNCGGLGGKAKIYCPGYKAALAKENCKDVTVSTGFLSGSSNGESRRVCAGMAAALAHQDCSVAEKSSGPQGYAYCRGTHSALVGENCDISKIPGHGGSAELVCQVFSAVGLRDYVASLGR